jgi:RNase P/RNase MRP subunit p30
MSLNTNNIKYKAINACKMIDFVVPNNNEEEFIVIADRLGYNGLYFLYNAEDYLNKQGKFSANSEKIRIHTGILADRKSIHKIQNKLLDKAFIVVKSSDNDKGLIERSQINMIFGLEENFRKDFIHQRASGLNQVLCKLANKKEVSIGFSLKSILESKNRHEILGRMVQNMILCKKFKVRTAIVSLAQKPLEMRDVHDIASLFRVLESR